VSVHRALLDRDSAAALRRRAELVMSWPVEDVATAHSLVRLGVDGLISRDFPTVAAGLGLLDGPRATVERAVA
jgi:hypothetical protein